MQTERKSLRRCYRCRGSLSATLLRPLILLVLLVASLSATAQVRIKDIASVEGVRENQLVGYGLVVGLNNTGDKLDNSVFTRESLIGMLERLGVNTRDQVAKLSTKNIAAVMVTADLPAFARSGSRIDVAVSALGDAADLTGGTLLVTPLLAADGEAVRGGPGRVVTDGRDRRAGAATSVAAAGVHRGAHRERRATVEAVRGGISVGQDEFPSAWLGDRSRTTARRIAAAINTAIGPVARAIDPRTVALDLAGRDPIEALAALRTCASSRTAPQSW